MKTIKKIRFVSACLTAITYFFTNVHPVYAINIENYVNANNFSRFSMFLLLLITLMSVIIFVVSSVYILIKE